jgi:hypothetical protein
MIAQGIASTIETALDQLLMNEILPAARQNRVATLFLEVHENNQKFN